LFNIHYFLKVYSYAICNVYYSLAFALYLSFVYSFRFHELVIFTVDAHFVLFCMVLGVYDVAFGFIMILPAYR